MGLFEEGSHFARAIPQCQVHHPLINSLVETLERGIRLLEVAPYNEQGHRGLLRYVQLAVAPAADNQTEQDTLQVCTRGLTQSLLCVTIYVP